MDDYIYVKRPTNRILLVDDEPSHARALEGALPAPGAPPSALEWVRTLSAGLAAPQREQISAIFLNLRLPDSSGVESLQKILSVTSVPVPVVVIGGADDEESCKTAMLHGAADYLLEGHLDSYAFSRAIRNINERETARHELFSEKERAQVTLNSIGDAVLSTDIDGNVTYLNVVAETMTGWSRNEALGRPVTEVFQIIDAVAHKAAPNPLEMAVRLDKVAALSANCILVRRDGRETAIEDSAAPIHDLNGKVTGAVIVFHDVSMAGSKIQEMSHLARHDVLTDLPNRSLLNDRLVQAISMARRNQTQVAVLFLDLDGFKRINDSCGHSVGDKLLKSVAKRLQAALRKSDTVSRQGGDEFVILLPLVRHAADVAVSAARILAALKEPHSIGERILSITGSIGLSTYPHDGGDADTLINNADSAMYHAKQSGGDSFQYFTSQMSLRAVERQSLEGQLRYALERHELALHYQPKVNLKTGAITSVEALLRWQHPQRGLLFPEQFLSIAEESGMIVSIGHWVLGEACRQMREWLDAGFVAVPVAVNISSVEFRGDQFLEGVRAALKASRVDPGHLELELTETVLMHHTGSTAYALSELKALGVRLAVDDFGTGYSSLSYLTRFPIDSLKIDRSFVRDVCDSDSSENAIVVSAVINMGKSLKHKVIAEGVETREQLSFLQAQSCDEGQGYYFSRPVAPHQFARLLQTGISATM